MNRGIYAGHPESDLTFRDKKQNLFLVNFHSLETQFVPYLKLQKRMLFEEKGYTCFSLYCLHLLLIQRKDRHS